MDLHGSGISLSEMRVGLAGICCKVNRKCSLTRYRRVYCWLIFSSASPNALSQISWDMESCIWILRIHWKNTMHAQRIAFNYGSLLLFFFWQVYLCFLSIAFVKSRGKGHGQVCLGKDGPYSPWTELVLQGLYALCATEQYSAGNSIKATALEEERGISCYLSSAENTTADQKASLLWCTLNRMGPLTAAF